MKVALVTLGGVKPVRTRSRFGALEGPPPHSVDLRVRPYQQAIQEVRGHMVLSPSGAVTGPAPAADSPVADGRDRLFISYASEDARFVDWLALRLTSEGYKVWYDRLMLLGGESYPRDIDRAIAEQTFRFVAVLSRASVEKANPRKERTQALNIARARGVDFLIPLKCDAVEPLELGWQLSDLTYIAFDASWSAGLAGLLKRLESLQAPRDERWGKAQIAKWLVATDCVLPERETIWSNLFPIRSVPATMQLFKVRSKEALFETGKVWPIAPHDATSYWAFSQPEEGLGAEGWPMSHVVNWQVQKEALGQPTRALLAVLVRRAVELSAIRRGLRPHPDRNEVFFPSGLFPSDRLYYTGYDGKKTFVQVVGERTRKRQDKTVELTHYSLSFGVKPVVFGFGEPVVRLGIGAHFTDEAGRDLSPGRAGRKRKALGKSWWNYEWLSRVLACGSWLADGKPTVILARSSSGDLVLAGTPLSTNSPLRILEDALGPDLAADESDEEGDEDEIEESSESNL
jgi:hypothetical protein